MITYEVKLKKIGEMTILPDSQRLFGFLMNFSKQYCPEEEISVFVKDVREHKQKCMISSMLPTEYYPMPKAYVMQKLQKKLNKNQEKITLREEKQTDLRKEIELLIQTLLEKKKLVNEKKDKEEKKKIEKEIEDLKSELEDKKNEFNQLATEINNLSTKNIYETIKSMDFIKQDELKKFLNLSEKNEKISIEVLKNYQYIKKKQTFIQKFRLENQIQELPGMPNVAYALPILSFENQKGEIQKDFSFFVRAPKESCLAKGLEGMQTSLQNHDISCFLGAKGSSGYNKYQISSVEVLDEQESKGVSNTAYLNLGVLLPNFNNIDVEHSFLDIYTSDRKPFEIENEIPKVISFVTAGSVIQVRDDGTDLYQVGKSIDNSKYNPLYKKNAIIFGNAYLIGLEASNEASF